MPLLNLTPPAATPVTGPKTQSVLQTNIPIDKELSVNKIKYQVSGLRWTVDFFNQILDVNSQPLAPDINIPETTLRYNRINKLDIYVDSGLPNSTVLDVTGNGTVNAGIVPYFGDAFVATLSGNRTGIFVITQVTKNYYNSHDIYSIDFKLTYFLDTSSAMYNNLVFKTIRTYVYDKEAINTSGAPVLLEDDFVKRIDLKKQPNNIIDHYIDTFYDEASNFFKLPTTASMYVDQLATAAIFKLMNVSDVPKLNSISRLDKGITAVTVWDALFNRDIELFRTCNTTIKYGISSVGGVSMKVTTYLGIEYTITDKVSTSPIPVVIDNPLMIRKVVASPITGPVTGYIFSDAFYNEDPNTVFTVFETTVMDYLYNRTPNVASIENIISEYKYWDYQSQYMLLPIVLLLVKTLINTQYSAI